MPKIRKLAQAEGPSFELLFSFACFLKILRHFHDPVKNYDPFCHSRSVKHINRDNTGMAPEKWDATFSGILVSGRGHIPPIGNRG